MNFTPDYLVIARDSSDSKSTNFVNLRRPSSWRPRTTDFGRSHRRTFRYFFGLSISSPSCAHPQGTATSSERRLASSNTNCQRTWLPAFEHGVRTPKRSRPKSQHPSSVRPRTSSVRCLDVASRLRIRSWRRGGAEEDRTPDPLRARQVLSQLSYGPVAFGLLGHTTRWS